MKNKGRKKKTKRKTEKTLFRILLSLVIVLTLCMLGYYFLTAEDEESTLTLLEKQWIEKNKTDLIDIDLPNNLSIISEEGNGVVFDFLNYFEETTELTFNKIPYNYGSKLDNNDNLSIQVLKNTDKIEKDDIIICSDNYIVVSKKDDYLDNLFTLNNKKIGVLESDSEIIANYMKNYSISTYSGNDIDSLISRLNDNSVDFIIVPRYVYLDELIDGNLYTNYVLDDLANRIVLRRGKEEKLNAIVVKLLEKWSDKEFYNSYYKALLTVYKKHNELKDVDRTSLTNRVYNYGYLKSSGSSYNVIKNGDLYGVAGEYINSLETILGMDFNVTFYNTKEEMENDLKAGYLDVGFISFDYNDKNYLKTNLKFNTDMVVLSKTYQNITGVGSLINNKIYVYNDSYLYDYILSTNSDVKKIDNITNFNSKDELLVLDYNDYLYNKDDLQDYKVLFIDDYSNDYKFVVNKNSSKLSDIITFLVNNTSYNNYDTKAINDLYDISASKSSFKEAYLIVLAIIFLPIIVILLIISVLKNGRKLKTNKKENILKYNDVLTNLKNRNYLNDNIDKWDNMKIYPRTIIIIDLNNLKYVNDNYGHEEGNQLIEKAAAILINTQLEKSEIIRTDGNEFLIYLIGYSTKQIETYISKLSKEFEKLPFGFGAAIGYSVINDEIATIDDAINEASIKMRVDKENYK